MGASPASGPEHEARADRASPGGRDVLPRYFFFCDFGTSTVAESAASFSEPSVAV